jgi:hypothetical protein
MLGKDSDFWFETWNADGYKMLEIMSWMESEGIINIGQSTFLEYAMAIFLANSRSFDLPKFKTEIKKYSLYLSLSGNGFSKSNLDIVERMYSLSKHMTDSHESEKYNYHSLSSSPNLDTEQVLAITSGSKFKAIMNIFYIYKYQGNFTVDIMGNSIKTIDRKTMDNHHIFPRSRVTNFNAKSKFNSIANFVIVDSSANRIDIKDKIPKVYFSEINSQGDAEFYCKQNLIEFSEVKNIETENEAEIFIKKRAGIIADIINSYF